MKSLALCIAIFASLAAAAQDLTVRVRETHDQMVVVRTISIHGARQREESQVEHSAGPQMPATLRTTSILYQCDEHKMVLLNDAARTFHVQPLDDKGMPLHAGLKPPPLPPATRGGTLTVSVETHEAGERKQVDGVEIRRFHETRTDTTSADSCNPQTPTKLETDAWYLDVPGFRCQTEPRQGVFMTGIVMGYAGDYRDKIEFKHTGDQPPAASLEVMGTHTLQAHGHNLTWRTELLELSRQPLDPKLFEVPPGYQPAQELPNGGYDMEHGASLWARCGRGGTACGSEILNCTMRAGAVESRAARLFSAQETP